MDSSTNCDPDRAGPELSIVIPAFNAAETIGSCVSSVISAAGQRSIEIIVVESSPSCDATARVLSPFPQVRLIKLAQRAYPGEARNAGIRVAKGGILAFVDAHCEVEADWVEAGIAAIARTDADAVGGSRLLHPTASIVGRLQYTMEFLDFLPRRHAAASPFLPAGNTFISAERLRRIGGDSPFPEELRACEDLVFGRRATARGFTLRFDPSIRCTYRPRQRWDECARHMESLGFWSAAARRRYAFDDCGAARLAPLIFPLLWAYRNLRYYAVVASGRTGETFWHFATAPIAGVLYARWTWGFVKGSRKSVFPVRAVSAVDSGGVPVV